MKTKITRTDFGTIYNGQKAHLFKIENGNAYFCVTDFGCTITSLCLKNKDGSYTDVVLGLETLDSYARQWGSFGAIVGRYANRIAGAEFSLNGETYKLTQNTPEACLHGGYPAWGNLLWNSKIVKDKKNKKAGICFFSNIRDGEQGFPGNLYVEIEYLLSETNQLSMVYRATTDNDNPLSITNHSYFNLRGKGTVIDYSLEMNCQRYVKNSEKGLPTGELAPVSNTEFDFTTERKINKFEEQNPDSIGYDLCYVTENYNSERGIPFEGDKVSLVATVTDPVSTRKMKVYTNQEGVQLYTAKYMDRVPGKDGCHYKPYEAICLETQSFPDSPNQKAFPSVILHPGQKYNAVTIYEFL